MTEFAYLAIGVSIILGLSVTTLLTSFLTLFVARHRIRMDWIPVVWGLYIFFIQIQFYGAFWGMNSRTVWNASAFALPLLLSGITFLAASLVLPTGPGPYPTDLRSYFERHGKYAILALVLRGVFAIRTNFIFSDYKFSFTNYIILVQILAALLFLFSRTRKFKVVATLLYGLAWLLTLANIYGGGR